MFGFLKKSVEWGELEFIFKIAACAVYGSNLESDAILVRQSVDTAIRKGGYKISVNQRSSLEAAYATLDISRELREAFKSCALPDGQIDAKRFIALNDLLAKHFILFRDFK